MKYSVGALMTAENPFYVVSSGAGVQSTAMLVLSAQGKIPYRTHVFANVGPKAENPDTLVYVETVLKPYAEKHGITFVELHAKRDLYDVLMDAEGRSVPIPVYMQGGMPGRRSCTMDWKIRLVDRWVRDYLRAEQGTHAVIGLGISIDEIHRARSEGWHDRENDNPEGRNLGFWRRRAYPLIDLHMRRDDCVRIVAEAGLPTPPKSSCWFCPFRDRSYWIDLKRNHAARFAQAVDLEARVNEKRGALEKDAVYLHKDARPLEEAVPDQMSLFDLMADADECESGYCLT